MSSSKEGCRTGGCSRGGVWSAKQNKAFEEALAVHDKESDPQRWGKIARAVGGGKSVEDCIRHYADLIHDIRSIEEGRIPFPNYT